MEKYEYTTAEAVSAEALSEWSFKTHLSCETLVLPDGCRDIIAQDCPKHGPSWFVSELSHAAYTVPTAASIEMYGLRLKPGIEIRQSELSAWLGGKSPAEFYGSDQLSEFLVEKVNLTSALQCLASGRRTVLCVAKDLGVSLRTLERFVKAETGESPYFWFSLARIRKTGRSLVKFDNLTDAALDVGFSDQSHMSREIKKWFQRTPNQLKGDSELLSLLTEPGYG